MRLLIAAGGTGGHIYPALAVARSLRARPDAPELAWLGGHRGLEAGLVPAAGIPFRRLALRSLRSVERQRPRRPRPAPARCVRAAGGGHARPPTTRRDLHDRRLRRDPGRCWRRPRSGIPVVLWDGNVIPGRAVRATARLADVARGLVRGDVRGPARPRRAAVLRDGHADPRHAAIDRAAARERLGIPPERPGAADLRRLAGGPSLQRRRRRRPAASRRAGHRHPRHRRGRLRGGAGRARGAARGRPRRATGRIRSCATTCSPRSRPPTSSSGAPGSSTLAEVTALGLPMVVVPYPHAGRPPARERPACSRTPARRRLIDDADFDADALLAAAAILSTIPWPPGDGGGRARARPAGRRGRRRRPRPGRAQNETAARPGRSIDRRAPGRRDRTTTAPLRRDRDRDGRSSAGSGSRRRATSRWRGSRRCASAARPTCSPPCTTSSSCARSSASPGLARSPHCSSGGAATSSSATRVPRPRDPGSAPRARSVDGDVHRRGRRADGQGRDRDAEGGPVRPRIRAGDPGHGRWRRVGQRRRPRGGRGGGARVGPESWLATGREERRARRASSSSATATAASSTRPDGTASSSWRRPSGSSRPTRTRSRPASTTSAAGARHTSRSGCRRPGASSATRDGDSAGRLIEAAGLKGTRIGGAVVSEKHANFIVNDQKGTAADVRRLGDQRPADAVAAATGIELRSRSSSSATGTGWRGVAPADDDARPTPPADRRPARRPVGRARRLDRVGHGHRGGAWPRPAPTSARS